MIRLNPHLSLSAVRPTLMRLAMVIAPFELGAQAVKAPEQDAVMLSAFEVSTSSDRGLLSTNAVSATKNNTPIKEIPGNIYVLNEGFIKDQIPFDLNDILRFAPGLNLDGDYRNETYQIRGFSGGLPLADGFTISRSFPTEQAAVERVEVLQGPAGILFGNVSGVGGIVNRILKKPQFKPATSMTFSARNDSDNFRLVYDSTGPVGSSKRLAYRVIAVLQHTDGFQDFVKLDRQFLRAALTWRISDRTKLTIEPDLTLQRTVIGYRYDYFSRSGNGAIIRVPVHSNPAENYMHTNNVKPSMMTTFTHELSSDWFVRAATFTTINFLHDDDPRIGTALNADNRTIARGAADAANGFPTGFLQQQERAVGNYYFQADVVGTTRWGSIINRPIAGVEWKRDPNNTNIRRTTTGLGGIANAPFDLLAPNYGQYAYPTGIVTFNQQYSIVDAYGGYLNDQINLFDNHLKLVAGIRFIKSTTSSRDRVRQNAENAAAARTGRTPINTITYGHTDWDNVKRYGAVYDVTKDLGAYASYSESYQAVTTVNNLGELFPPGLGKQKEAGIKTGFLNGRLTSTLSIYQLTQTNNILSYATGTTGPRGETQAAVGQVQAKGIDLSGVVSVTDNLQFLPSYSHTKAVTLIGGSLTTAGPTTSNLEVSKYPRNVVKLFGKYTIKGGALDGMSFNGGFVYTQKVDEGILAGIAPFPTTTRTSSIIPSSTVWNLGANIWRRGWGYSAKIDNISNLRYYIPSASSNTRALLGMPRVVSVEVTRKF